MGREIKQVKGCTGRWRPSTQTRSTMGRCGLWCFSGGGFLFEMQVASEALGQQRLGLLPATGPDQGPDQEEKGQRTDETARENARAGEASTGAEALDRLWLRSMLLEDRKRSLWPASRTATLTESHSRPAETTVPGRYATSREPGAIGGPSCHSGS